MKRVRGFDAHWHLTEAWRQWLHLCRMRRLISDPVRRAEVERRRDAAAERVDLWSEVVMRELHRRA